jgi:hypothetical protein
MVDSPAGKPLHLRQRDEAKKVFNVASSRARNQLWVVHSLQPDRDLKIGDLRYRLLKHAQDPTGLRKKIIVKEDIFKSDLQKSVHRELQSRKYRLLLNFEVGLRTIDIVAQGDERQRLAIQCDGECIKTEEDLLLEMDYYSTLRRLNWDIFHIRATEYYTDPDKTLKRLFRRMNKAGITPIQEEQTEQKPVSPDLYDMVTKKANSIRIRWNEPIKPLPVKSEKQKNGKKRKEVKKDKSS